MPMRSKANGTEVMRMDNFFIIDIHTEKGFVKRVWVILWHCPVIRQWCLKFQMIEWVVLECLTLWGEMERIVLFWITPGFINGLRLSLPHFQNRAMRKKAKNKFSRWLCSGIMSVENMIKSRCFAAAIMKWSYSRFCAHSERVLSSAQRRRRMIERVFLS